MVIRSSDLQTHFTLPKTQSLTMSATFSMPDLDILCAIADIFDVSLDYLLGRSDFNLPNHLLKKKIGKSSSAGKLLETIIRLDSSHSSDLVKMLYYIEMDNNRLK